MVHDISDDRRAGAKPKRPADAGSRPARLRASDARDGFGIRGCSRAVGSIALRLVAPDMRRAEKKVR